MCSLLLVMFKLMQKPSLTVYQMLHWLGFQAESETMEWLRKYVREVEDGIKGNYFITVKNKF